MKPRVLLGFEATSYRPDAYVAAAAREGIELLLATNMLAAASGFGLAATQVDFARVEGAAIPCEQWRHQSGAPLAGVVAADEASAAFVARVAQHYGLPFHTPLGVDAARDKRLSRRRLRAAGVSVPRYWVLPADCPVMSLAVTFPCVVKPSMLSGSQGVIRADDSAALEVATAVTRGIVRHHGSALKGLAGFDELLIEAYVPGAEVAVEGLMDKGTLQPLALFDKPDPLEGPYFEETLYVTPSRHAVDKQRAVIAVVQQACVALGLCHGPIHAELRLSDEGPVVIEVAARSIGGLCSQVLSRRVGSLEGRILRGAVGRARRPLVSAPPAVGVMMLPVTQNGVLRAVEGVEAAAAVPHIDGVNIALKPGDVALMLPYGNRYLGFIFAHGPTPAAVESALRQAHAQLRFRYRRLLRRIC